MAVTIAGNTLSDLSQASLAEQALRDRRRNEAMNMARRAYEFGNLSAGQAADVDLSRNQLALEREYRFAPWERGMTPTETAADRYRNAFLSQQQSQFEKPYSQMTQAEVAADERARQAAQNQMTVEFARYGLVPAADRLRIIANQPLIEAQANELMGRSKYWEGIGKNGGQMPEGLLRDLYETKVRKADTAREVDALASRANQILEGNLPTIRNEIVDMLDTWGRYRSNAKKIAEAIVTGADLKPFGDDEDVLNANALFEKRLADITLGLGDSSGYVKYNRKLRMFRPDDGTILPAIPQAQPANQLTAPTVAAPAVAAPSIAVPDLIRGPGGRLVPAGAAGPAAAPVVAPAVVPQVARSQLDLRIGNVPLSAIGRLGSTAGKTLGTMQRAARSFVPFTGD